MKQIFVYLLILLSLALQAQEPQPADKETSSNSKEEEATTSSTSKVDDDFASTVFFRGSTNTVDSATAANALKVSNAFLINRAVQGRNSFSIPTVGQFTGTGIEIGGGGRSGKVYKSNWLLSNATLRDTSSSVLDYDAYAFLSSSFSYAYRSTSLSNFTSNTLQTNRLSYMAEFFPWHSAAPLLQKLGLRAGPELYLNALRMSAPTGVYSDTGAVSSGTTAISLNGSGLDVISQRKIAYGETFLNAVIGFSYALDINQLRIDFGFDYFRSFASAGAYKSTANSLAYSPIGTLPNQIKDSGSFITDLSGYRLSAGVKYQILENLGIRLSGGMTNATHDVTSSKFKDGSGVSVATVYTSVLTKDYLPVIMGSQPGFGPNPSSSDKRTQIGLEVFFRY